MDNRISFGMVVATGWRLPIYAGTCLNLPPWVVRMTKQNIQLHACIRSVHWVQHKNMVIHDSLEYRRRGEGLAKIWVFWLLCMQWQPSDSEVLTLHVGTDTCTWTWGVQCTCALPRPLIKTPATKTVEEAETTVNGLLLQYIAPFSLTEEHWE